MNGKPTTIAPEQAAAEFIRRGHLLQMIDYPHQSSEYYLCDPAGNAEHILSATLFAKVHALTRHGTEKSRRVLETGAEIVTWRWSNGK